MDKDKFAQSESSEDNDRTEYDAWFIRQVEEGLAQAEAGKVIPSEEVEAYFAVRRDELLRRIRDGS